MYNAEVSEHWLDRDGVETAEVRKRFMTHAECDTYMTERIAGWLRTPGRVKVLDRPARPGAARQVVVKLNGRAAVIVNVFKV